eukprot:gb/GFBE01022285.1/.p1 GENE.gb/GFBE01022285.1/~~gb/GFBE01022285.1/.p1  ORF type:complete len:113 (+),score=19.57 gb/GFBE01022285.1/:1-339(+)
MVGQQGASVSSPSGDVERGSKYFKRFCAMCHHAEPDAHLRKKKFGPPLWGVHGRRPGVEASHTTSSVWDDVSLMQYMDEPGHAVGSDGFKHFQGIKDSQMRADILSFLKSLS